MRLLSHRYSELRWYHGIMISRPLCSFIEYRGLFVFLEMNYCIQTKCKGENYHEKELLLLLLLYQGLPAFAEIQRLEDITE